ncbi:MAG TPA: ABC transporter substrate-binding protein [Thermoanaerobaculia bacterium]|nr:ABC transporter substrate-binding protein [Thermoanaerobaculia bacterium]
MTRRRFQPGRFLLLLLTFATLAAAAARLPAAGEPPPGRVRLRVLYGRYLTFAPLAIASAEGFFDAQGLDVELVHTTGSVDTTPLLIRGEIDVSAGMLRISDFNAIARGATLRLVADKGHYEDGPCVSAAFLIRPAFLKTKNLESPENLRGARVAVTPLGFSEYVLETLVNSKGLALSDLNLVHLQTPLMTTALVDGSLDFLHVPEPYLTPTLRSGSAVVWKPVREIVPGGQLAAVIYGPNLLVKNRETGRRFMVAYLQGVRQYNLGKTPRNVEIISRETRLEPGLVRDACWESIRPDGKINVESVLDYQRWAVRRQLLDAVLPPERFWDPFFVDEAGRLLGAKSSATTPGTR